MFRYVNALLVFLKKFFRQDFSGMIFSVFLRALAITGIDAIV